MTKGVKLARAVCPECSKELGVRPPMGGDGSCDVFPRHMPPRHMRRPGPQDRTSYCRGSRQEVPSTAYVRID